MKQLKCIITYSVFMLFFETVTAERHTYIFGNAHLPRPFLIFEVIDQTMAPAENFQVHFEVPIERRLTYVEVVVTGRIRPTVMFSWKRTTVEIQYNWWQLSEVIIYHIRALGQYKPLPTTTTEEPTTTTVTTTTQNKTKATTKRRG